MADVPHDLLFWEPQHNDPDTIKNIIEAVMRNGEAAFELGAILPGIAPNAGQPTTYQRDIHVGLKGDAPRDRRTVDLTVHVDWEYATGDRAPQTNTLTIGLPIGKPSTGGNNS